MFLIYIATNTSILLLGGMFHLSPLPDTKSASKYSA